MTRALAGGSAAKRGELLERAGGDDLAAAVVVGGGQPVLLAGRGQTSSGSPPMTALMPVGVTALRGGHGPAALADEAPSPARR